MDNGFFVKGFGTQLEKTPLRFCERITSLLKDRHAIDERRDKIPGFDLDWAWTPGERIVMIVSPDDAPSQTY